MKKKNLYYILKNGRYAYIFISVLICYSKKLTKHDNVKLFYYIRFNCLIAYWQYKIQFDIWFKLIFTHDILKKYWMWLFRTWETVNCALCLCAKNLFQCPISTTFSHQWSRKFLLKMLNGNRAFRTHMMNIYLLPDMLINEILHNTVKSFKIYALLMRINYKVSLKAPCI